MDGKTWLVGLIGTIIGGLIVGFAVWFFTSLYVPTQIFKYQREAEDTVVKMSGALKEARTVLDQIKASSQQVDAQRQEIDKFITELKTDKFMKQLTSQLAKLPQFNKRYADLEEKIDKLESDTLRRFEALADIIQIESMEGYLKVGVTKTDTLKFRFPVKQAWVVVPYANCVNEVSIGEISNPSSTPH